MRKVRKEPKGDEEMGRRGADKEVGRDSEGDGAVTGKKRQKGRRERRRERERWRGKKGRESNL